MVEDRIAKNRQSSYSLSVMSLGLVHLGIITSSWSSESAQLSDILECLTTSIRPEHRYQSDLVKILILNIFEALQIHQ